jgi:hypothetical protein
MKYSELVEQGASKAQRQDYLTDGVPTPITLRVPKNLKQAAAEAARFRGVSFSAFIRTCVINELAKR